MKKARNLQYSLLLSFASVSLIPITLMAAVIINHLFGATVDEINAKNQLLARGVSSQVELYLSEPLSVLYNVSTMMENSDMAASSSLYNILDSHVTHSELIDAIYLLDPEYYITGVGLPEGKEAFRRDLTGINLGHKEFIRKAAQTGKPAWSETFISLIVGKMSLSLCLPAKGHLLVADINITHLSDIINRLNHESDIITSIIDQRGAIIIHPDPEIAARQIMTNDIDIVRKSLSGEMASGRYAFLGLNYIGATQNIKDSGWITLVSQPLEKAYHPIHVTLAILVACILGATLLTFLFAIYKAKQLSKPLAELTEHTRTIAGGDYKFFLPSTDYEEVQELSFSISQMTSAINFREQLLIDGEQKFREVIEATDNLITRVDRNANFTFVNPAAEKIFGILSGEIQGRSMFDFVHPDDRDRSRMAFEKWKRERRKSVAYENRQISRDGKIYYMLWTINIHYDQNGMMTEASSIGNNITSRIEAQEQKKQFEEHIIHAQKMEAIGTLAGGIAHDFNNILTAIIGYTELTLFSNRPSPEICGNLDEILKASHRAKELVKQILAFSRKDESVKKPINLAPLVRESLKMLRASIPATIEIKEDVLQNCGLVMADPTKIHQVVMNLCTNAYQAMRNTGGVLSVSLTIVDASELKGEVVHTLRQGAYLKLTVSDTGGGIDPAVKDKIFEPFFTTKPQGEGTGMGLSVVHGIVLSHAGHTAVQNSPGSGATFIIYLPVIPGEENELENSAKQSFHPGTEQIIVVDDEKAITDFVRRSLTNLGYKVTVFNDPEKALAYIQNTDNLADIVITDMTMPNMNGAELAGAISKIRPDLPIIMFTGFSDLVDEKTAAEFGIRKYITKPFEIHQITEIIREFLDKT